MKLTISIEAEDGEEELLERILEQFAIAAAEGKVPAAMHVKFKTDDVEAFQTAWHAVTGE